jgi:hypothetical protein
VRKTSIYDVTGQGVLSKDRTILSMKGTFYYISFRDRLREKNSVNRGRINPKIAGNLYAVSEL